MSVYYRKCPKVTSWKIRGFLGIEKMLWGYCLFHFLVYLQLHMIK